MAAMAPRTKLIGGIVVGVAELSLQALNAAQALDYFKNNSPRLYGLLVGRESFIVAIAVSAILIPLGIWELRKERTAKANEKRSDSELLATKQEIRDSSIGGDARMAGRDYHEIHQTNVNTAPLLEARLAEFQKIDEFIGNKDEMQ